jgi:hypothetical protein
MAEFQKYSMNPLENKDAEGWFQLSNGTKVFIPRNFFIRLDIPNQQWTVDEVEGLPTLNDLVAERKGQWVFPYEQLSYVDETIENRLSENVDNFNPQLVKKWFEERGFKVSIKAIKHNFDAWRFDYKSGFRDEKNGYHLFSPCGCNILSFHLTTLHPTAKEWQKTYEW